MSRKYNKLTKVNIYVNIEVRVQHGSNNFRLLGFEHNGSFVVLTNAFRKKDQKVPKKEIALAEKRKRSI